MLLLLKGNGPNMVPSSTVRKLAARVLVANKASVKQCLIFVAGQCAVHGENKAEAAAPRATMASFHFEKC